MSSDIVASKKRPATVLQDEQIKALIAGCSNRAPTGIRNRALIAVLWRCGLRIAEALALARADIDLQGDVLTVRHGKGDKARKLGLDATTSALLGRWIDKRAQLGLNKRGRPLFCTLKGRSRSVLRPAPTDPASRQGRSRPRASSRDAPQLRSRPSPRRHSDERDPGCPWAREPRHY
jgi:integrase